MTEKVNSYKPVYVRNIPRELEQGIVYISFDFGTSMHLCPCGCGQAAVTPFQIPELDRTYQWVFSERDGQISLFPSIENTACPNRSHYYITHGQVIWC
jgi:hypothetical protein